jgi:O-antigen/teichoic acid export membrane protein
VVFRTFGVATAGGHANERQRRVVLCALASALAKVISVSTALISVPLTLHYLGAERYGMWMTMSSLVAMLGFADLGIGNSLLTSVASAHGRDDREEIKVYVSSAYFVLSLIALAIVTLFGLAYPFVDWSRIFNVQSDLARTESSPALATMILCFALAMPLAVAQKVQTGLQRGYAASLWQCAASSIALAGVLLAIDRQAPLPWLVLAFVGASPLVGLVNSVTFFLLSDSDIAPSWRSLSIGATRSVAGIGLLFLVLQVVGALSFASDNIIIAHVLGAEAVANYTVPAQMFNLISTVLMATLAPLWPAYAEAIARGDRAWVSKTLRRSVILSVGFASVCSTVLVGVVPWIIGMWVGDAVAPPLLLLVGLGVWKVVEAGGNALAMFLNGAKVVRTQVVISSLTCISALVGKILLISDIGTPGIIWATVVSFLIFAALPYSLILKKLLSRLK